MKKFLGYFLGVFCWISALSCYATDKFEILPDLPDPLAQVAQASTVSKNNNLSTIVGPQNVSNEPNIISVVLSLIFVVVLIYLTGILYAKLNKLGFKTLKKQQGELSKSQVAVVSTTQLGSNKSLHVVELNGKRMLIGASSSNIQLIKDLGAFSEDEEEEVYSHIEIPNIKIPKIEIPKIEIPSIGFSRMKTKLHKNPEESMQEKIDTIVEEPTDAVIEQLFPEQEEINEEPPVNDHIVDPDEFALYRKYLKK